MKTYRMQRRSKTKKEKKLWKRHTHSSKWTIETPLNAPTYVIHGQTTAIVITGSVGGGDGGNANDGYVVYKSNNEWLQFHNSLMQINPRQYKSAHDSIDMAS